MPIPYGQITTSEIWTQPETVEEPQEEVKEEEPTEEETE